MAKVTFSKLNLTKNTSIKILEWNNQKIEVKQYLPIAEKLDLISLIINMSADEHVFYNPCKVEIFENLQILLAYSNINLTEKQQEDILKLYDLFVSSGFLNAIKELIPKEELEYIHTSVLATIQEIYRYKTSAMGIIEQVVTDYKDTELDANKIVNELSDGKLKVVKDVITNLG